MKKSKKEIIDTKKIDEDIECEDEIVARQKEDKLVKFVLELIPYLVILVVVVVIRTYICTPIIVSGPSMQPTLDGGELMLLNKLSNFDRFDVVVVDIETEEIIKRIIALPGETITCERGIVYVNGKRQDEEYSQGYTFDFEKITLAEDEYFVMGDNREDSKDSRMIGPIKEDQIKGTAKFVLYPFGEFGNIE